LAAAYHSLGGAYLPGHPHIVAVFLPKPVEGAAKPNWQVLQLLRLAKVNGSITSCYDTRCRAVQAHLVTLQCCLLLKHVGVSKGLHV